MPFEYFASVKGVFSAKTKRVFNISENFIYSNVYLYNALLLRFSKLTPNRPFSQCSATDRIHRHKNTLNQIECIYNNKDNSKSKKKTENKNKKRIKMMKKSKVEMNNDEFRSQ